MYNKLIYCWYSSKLNSFLTFNTNIEYFMDCKNRDLIKITANNEDSIFKTPLKIPCNNYEYRILLEKKKKYQLVIYGYSDTSNKNDIHLWINSINKTNNGIERINLELYPVCLRNPTKKGEIPTTIYQFSTNNNIDIWFGFDIKMCDKLIIYKIQLFEIV